MSAILSADDLNDFISPGVACIKPIESIPANEGSGTSSDISAQPPPAQISLTDCLACSGCVTSAEAVLVSLQSHSEVLAALDAKPGLRLRNDGSRMVVDGLDQGGKLYVASVSPQTRASIAATYKVSEQEAGHMIEHLLRGPRGIKNRGVYRNAFQWVVDTNVAREASLVLGAKEVLESHQQSDTNTKLPILTSACPGWVCYAEKTHPHVLPHLSTLKSPQALMGTLLKTMLSTTLGIKPQDIWHVAIMPCFDKKLEASRSELTDAHWSSDGAVGVRDVDCVITSKELLMLAESRGVDFKQMSRTPLPPYAQTPFPDPTTHAFLYPPARRKAQAQRQAGTSGGYLHHILQDVVFRHPGSRVESSRGRNVDIADFTVVSADGDVIFRAARYYGFRNIQNLVRRLKPAAASRMPGAIRRAAAKGSGLEHAYVEVMACPGGCTNGGGQIKLEDNVLGQDLPDAKSTGPQQKEWLAQVDEAYFSGDESDDGASASGSVDGHLEMSKHVDGFLEYWSSTTRVPLVQLVHTTYRAVVSDVGKKVSDTERAIEIASKIGGGW